MVKSSMTAETKDVVMNRGAWTDEEDKKLMYYVHAHGDKRWRTLPAKAGLNRCGKSCRLRWLNYLRPGIKRGNISEEEDDLIIRLHNLLGNRWSLIAGRLPGRTDNEIKNHWNTHLSKKSLTITDLNSKLNHVPQNNSHQSNACHVPPPRSLPSSSIEATLMGDENQPWSDICHQMSFDMDELFNLPFLQEFSYITSPEPYHSLSKIWLLPSTTMGGESSSSGIAGLPCYTYWSQYPPMAI